MLYQHKLLNNSIVVFFRTKSNFSIISYKISGILSNSRLLKGLDMNTGKGNKNLTIQVIGSGAPGAPSSAILLGDKFRVLLNCGEGTQRLIMEHKCRWNLGAAHVFITDPSWKNISGLMGMALSLQNSKKRQLYIHGPELVENVFSATNRFIDIRSLCIEFMHKKNEQKYVESSYEVQYVPLYPFSMKKLKENKSDSKLVTSSVTAGHVNDDFQNRDDDEGSDYYEHSPKHNKNHKSKKKKRSHSQVCEMKNHETVYYSMSYIFNVNKCYKLLIEKCVDLNVPVGPLLNKLKNGEDVYLENGNLVRSSDVLELVSPSTVVIVLECPSEEYLDSLLQEPAFFKHQTKNIGEVADAVIHFTTGHLTKNPKYREWINRFSKETKHLFINESNSTLGSTAIHRFQYKLNAIHPEIFPLLPMGGIPLFPRNPKEDPENSKAVADHELNSSKSRDAQEIFNKNIYLDKIFYKCKKNIFINAETLCEVYVRPKLEYDYSRSIIIKPELYLSEIRETEGFLENLDKLKLELDKVKLVNELGDQKYPKIVFLGTGCSQPSIYRNPSGILIFLDDENNSILLDCGEGTHNQLIQFFGEEKTKNVLKNLKMIFISHLHSDHHIGLVKLLKERKLIHDKEMASVPDRHKSEYRPLKILGPFQLISWLNFFSKNIENISKLYSIIFTKKLAENEVDHDDKSIVTFLNDLNMREIKTARMIHCSSSFGVAFTHKNNWKLTYSGDTRPNDNLVNIGINSDILIHEATFDDSLISLAKSKFHSTTSEAVEIGKQMNAKFILLTHFSQRYSHLPLLTDDLGARVGIAFDNMTVSFNQLPILSKLYPSMKCLLSKYYDGMIERRDLAYLKRKLIRADEESPKKAKNLA